MMVYSIVKSGSSNTFRFGEVVNGKSIIRKIEGLKTQSDDKPTLEVSIIGKILSSNNRLKI